jgi:hypothetical protein
MIRLEAGQLEQLSAAVPLNVFGIRLEWFIAIVGVVGCFILFAFWQWWQNKKRAKNFEASKGHILIEFLPENGSIPVDRVLCEEHKGAVKKIERSGRMFSTNLFARPKDKSIDKMLDEYYLLPEHDYKDYWPYGARSSQQVSITKYYFKINDPCPYMPHDMSRWDTEKYARLTATLSRTSKDDVDSEMMMKELKGAYTSIENMVSKLKYIVVILIIVIAGLFVSGVGAFMAYRSSVIATEALNAIVRFVTGK